LKELGIEIRIFELPRADNPIFRRVALTVGATEIDTIEKFHEPGSFSFSVPTGNRVARKIKIGQCVLIDRTFWGIIDDMKKTATAAGKMMTVEGRQLKGLTMDRVTVPPSFNEHQMVGAQGYDTVIGSTETCMKHFVHNNMTLGTRAIAGLEILPDQGRGVQADKYMSRHDKLSDVLLDLGEAGGLGYDIVPDLAAGKFIFDVICGADRSATQRDRPPVIFEIPRRSVASQDYSFATSGAKNTFYATMAGAEFADEAFTMIYAHDGEEIQTGIDRREVQMTISATHPEAGQEYAELRRLAMIQAQRFLPDEGFQCDVTKIRHKYKADYWLGDIVTAQNREWGVVVHAPVTAVSTKYSQNGIQRRVTFGDAPLNVFGRLQRQIRGG